MAKFISKEVINLTKRLNKYSDIGLIREARKNGIDIPYSKKTQNAINKKNFEISDRKRKTLINKIRSSYQRKNPTVNIPRNQFIGLRKFLNNINNPFLDRDNSYNRLNALGFKYVYIKEDIILFSNIKKLIKNRVIIYPIYQFSIIKDNVTGTGSREVRNDIIQTTSSIVSAVPLSEEADRIALDLYKELEENVNEDRLEAQTSAINKYSFFAGEDTISLNSFISFIGQGALYV